MEEKTAAKKAVQEAIQEAAKQGLKKSFKRYVDIDKGWVSIEEAPDDADEIFADIGNPRGWDFNEEQLVALEDIRGFMESRETIYGLYGYAGTGKTSVIQQIVHEYLGRWQVALVAPTHKAVGVLRDLGAGYGLESVHKSTIHSILRLRPRKKEGRVFYTQDRRKEPPIADFTLIIIDECSMVDQGIWDIMLAETSGQLFEGSRKKVIVMGDELQLPPVSDNTDGNDESPTFSIEKFSRLTHVMRHAGIIGDAVDAVRENITSQRPVLPQSGKDEFGGIAYFKGREKWFQKFIDIHEAGWNIKMLSFTNRSVDKANKTFREMIYGRDVPAFIEEEIVVSRDAYAPPPDGWEENAYYRHDDFSADVLIRTEDGGVILEAVPTVHLGFDCWRLRIALDNGKVVGCYAVDDAQRREVDKLLSRYRKANNWAKFWPTKETFASLRPWFSTTIHKSQGSTYDYVFVDLLDILQSSSHLDTVYRNRLMYVALSRAKRGLVMYSGSS